MPELPEVESARRRAARALEGRRIERVCTVDDPIVYEGVTPRRFARALQGRLVLAIHRKGKHLWMVLDERPFPLFHFGMTGSFELYRREADRPRFWKVEILMEDGTRLAMPDARRFGRIRLRHEPEDEPPIKDLGFDPLHGLPAVKELHRLLVRRRAPLKAVLLDQSLFAGVGNWIADEVLFQARLRPDREASGLRARETGAPARPPPRDREARGGGGRRFGSLPALLALPPPLGQERGRAHGRGREDHPRHHRRTHHRVGALAAAVTSVREHRALLQGPARHEAVGEHVHGVHQGIEGQVPEGLQVGEEHVAQAEEEEAQGEEEPDAPHGPAEAQAQAQQDDRGHEQDEVEDGVDEVERLLERGRLGGEDGPEQLAAAASRPRAAVAAPMARRSPGLPVGRPASSYARRKAHERDDQQGIGDHEEEIGRRRERDGDVQHELVEGEDELSAQQQGEAQAEALPGGTNGVVAVEEPRGVPGPERGQQQEQGLEHGARG